MADGRSSILSVLVAFGMVLSGVVPTLLAQDELKIVVVEGEDGVNIIDQKTAVPTVVEVRDRNGLPIAGVAVTFTIAATAGGGGAAFTGGLSTITATTDAAGRAVASQLQPLTDGAFRINIQASFQGQTASTSVGQTNLVTAPVKVDPLKPPNSGGGGMSTTAIVATSAAVAGGVVGAAAIAEAVNSCSTQKSALDSQADSFENSASTFESCVAAARTQAQADACLNQVRPPFERFLSTLTEYCSCAGSADEISADDQAYIGGLVRRVRSRAPNVTFDAACFR